MTTETERVATLEKALRMAQYELITLHPRLSDPYRKNVRACLDHVDAALLPPPPTAVTNDAAPRSLPDSFWQVQGTGVAAPGAAMDAREITATFTRRVEYPVKVTIPEHLTIENHYGQWYVKSPKPARAENVVEWLSLQVAADAGLVHVEPLT